MNQHKPDDHHPIIVHRSHLSFGQKCADFMTKWMGSWLFLNTFLFFVAAWIVVLGHLKGWDPYPFILLNLALSLISALQAPIIMMSQNRQTERDRIAAQYDYAVNRRAEREIQQIQQDLDEIKALLAHQQKIQAKRKV